MELYIDAAMQNHIVGVYSIIRIPAAKLGPEGISAG